MSDVHAQYEGFCTMCGVDVPSFEGMGGCTNCGSKGVPCMYDDQVLVEINAHELHLLCCWAEKFGMKIDEKEGGPGLIYAIVERLKRKNSLLRDKSLTLADEIEGLREAGFELEHDIPGIENPPLRRVSGKPTEEELRDKRIVYGIRCSWWDSIGEVGKRGDLPCCPHCRGMLMEMDSIETWHKNMEKYVAESGDTDYPAFIAWARGKCFPDFDDARRAWEVEK